MIDFRILGPIELQRSGRPVALGGHRQVALLAYLLLRPNQPVSQERIAGELWPELDRRTAIKRLQLAVTRLRKALGPGLLLTVPGGYRLDLEEPGQLDRHRFESGVAAGRGALDEGRYEEAGSLLTGALELWRGSALTDVAYEDFAIPDIKILDEARLGAVEARVEADLGAGRHQALVPELEGLTARHPDREGLAGHLMVALYRCGRQTESLDVYQRVRARLAAELGLEPGPRLKELQTEILTQSLRIESPARSPAPAAAQTPALHPRGDDAVNRMPAAPDLFVGRRRELARLEDLLVAADGGEMRLVLVSGDAGIGKTSFIREFRQLAEARGARMLYGACDEEGELSYQPFVEALRGYVVAGFDRLRDAGLAPLLADLARAIPEIEPRRAAAEDHGDVAVQRWRLFAAVSAVLRDAASEQPVVLVLDDLQWADGPTRQMLWQVLGDVRGERLLIVVLHRADALADFETRLRRAADFTRVPLGGLTGTESSALITSRMPDAPEALVQRVVDEADGNPFFMSEIARSLLEAVGSDQSFPAEPPQLPRTVTEVVTKRLVRLDAVTAEVLQVAAVVGHAFELEVLSRAIGRDPRQVLDALDGAFVAGLLVEDAEVADRFRFSHALVRTTLYELRSVSWRRRMHLDVGRALEAMDDANPVELAHHFWHAREVGGAASAARHLFAAGIAADAALAWEEALRHYQRALAAIERAGGAEPPLGRVLLALGAAAEHSGESAIAKQTFERAAELARRDDDVRLLALAALGYGRSPASAHGFDSKLVGFLDETRTRLGPDEQVLRARVLARLAVEYAARPEARAEVDDLNRTALRLAEASDDDVVLAVVLASRHWTLSQPTDLRERCSVARRSLELAVRAGDRERELSGRQWWLWDLLELGRATEAEGQLRAYDDLVDRVGGPSYRGFSMVMHAMLELLHGNLGEAQELSEQAYALLQKADDPDAERVRALQRFALAFEAGDMRAAAEVTDRPPDDRPIWHCLRAWALAAGGDATEARSCALHPDDLERDGTWLAGTTALAHTAAAIGDQSLATAVRTTLNPYAERIAAVEGTVCHGAVAHALAAVAVTLGERSDAERLLRHAMALYGQMGANRWLDRARQELLQVLPPGGTPDHEAIGWRQTDALGVSFEEVLR